MASDKTLQNLNGFTQKSLCLICALCSSRVSWVSFPRFPHCRTYADEQLSLDVFLVIAQKERDSGGCYTGNWTWAWKWYSSIPLNRSLARTSPTAPPKPDGTRLCRNPWAWKERSAWHWWAALSRPYHSRLSMAYLASQLKVLSKKDDGIFRYIPHAGY